MKKKQLKLKNNLKIEIISVKDIDKERFNKLISSMGFKHTNEEKELENYLKTEAYNDSFLEKREILLCVSNEKLVGFISFVEKSFGASLAYTALMKLMDDKSEIEKLKSVANLQKVYEIEKLAVDYNYVQKGIGKVLISQVEEREYFLIEVESYSNAVSYYKDVHGFTDKYVDKTDSGYTKTEYLIKFKR